ncbi:MAG: hypothetical protein LC623_03095 [Halobacteriales archaeon]|nr:hypothetical protein [Halobacteriales archaeon]
MEPDRLADFQARWNTLSVRRDELARHFHADPQAPQGRHASPNIIQEWEMVLRELQRLEELAAAPRQ